MRSDKSEVLEILEAFNTPVVFHAPGRGWEESLPVEMKVLQVIRQRLQLVDQGGWDRATDAEVCCYMFTASLAHPLTRDWSEIYLYEAALFMPQLRDVLDAVPKELGPSQQDELADLKSKIRNSQKKHKKEVQLGIKVVITERGTGMLVGVVQDGADPILKTVEGDMATALATVPAMLAEAEDKWKVSPRNPAYKPPPKPTPKPVAKPAPVADLPLLANKPAAETKPEAQGIHVPEDGNVSTNVPTDASTDVSPDVPTNVSEKKPATTTIVEAIPEAGVQIVARAPAPGQAVINPAVGHLTHGPVRVAEVTPVDQGVPKSPLTAGATSAPPRGEKGDYEYWTKDGKGPFNTVQEAMDAAGVDKLNRPNHNRWDRLSAQWQEMIPRREKGK